MLNAYIVYFVVGALGGVVTALWRRVKELERGRLLYLDFYMRIDLAIKRIKALEDSRNTNRDIDMDILIDRINRIYGTNIKLDETLYRALSDRIYALELELELEQESMSLGMVNGRT